MYLNKGQQIMRDKNRIKPLLEKIEKYWLQNPDLRLGQLISNLNYPNSTDIYFIEDNVLEYCLDEMLSKNPEYSSKV